MRTFLTLLYIIPVLLLSGQTAKNDFSLIDKRVITIQSNSVESLANMLCSPYNKPIEKVRSIFKWITENIEYDVAGYHNIEGIYSGLFRPTIS
ncbi:MAG: hypothetical protein ABIS69_01215, partial [Sediminibacterium sp.]